MIMWVKLIKLKDMLKMLVFAFTFKIIQGKVEKEVRKQRHKLKQATII